MTSTKRFCRNCVRRCATRSESPPAWGLVRVPAFHRQAYKGGPNSGVFLQITCDDAADLPVPGQKYTFGVVKAAQARGDFQVLAERGRRALRVHLGKDLAAGLARSAAAFQQGSDANLPRGTARVQPGNCLSQSNSCMSYRNDLIWRRSGLCDWEWSVWARWAPT